MKFVDEVTIEVKAGKGGDGCCSFRREKFIPFGGPDGGDGGKGGDVYFKANSNLSTLVDLNYKKIYTADHGRGGSGNLRSGKSGKDLVIEVPVGTIVWDQFNESILGDLSRSNQVLLVARGGDGGLGNHHFKTSTNRAPRKFIKGGVGDSKFLRLELRLLADVGLLGLPNAGKSTLISRISSAKPRIADYPFTTLVPCLGVVKVNSGSFVMADLPGLIEGAAKGLGLGIRFLKHLSRNRLLLHILDLSSCISSGGTELATSANIINNLITQIRIINQEIINYNDDNLTRIPRWIVINKVDLVDPLKLSQLSIEFQNTIIQELPEIMDLPNAIPSSEFQNTSIQGLPEIMDPSEVIPSSDPINDIIPLASIQPIMPKIFWISGITGYGLKDLCNNVMQFLQNC